MLGSFAIPRAFRPVFGVQFALDSLNSVQYVQYSSPNNTYIGFIQLKLGPHCCLFVPWFFVVVARFRPLQIPLFCLSLLSLLLPPPTLRCEKIVDQGLPRVRGPAK